MTDQQEVAQRVEQSNIQEPLPNGTVMENPMETLAENVKDVQSILNDMVWKHGGNLDRRPDFLELLSAYGLQKSEISKAMLKVAEKETKKKARILTDKVWTEDENKKLIWMPEPDEEELSLTPGKKIHVWETKCGRYRIYRFTNAPGDVEYAGQYRTPEASWDIFEHAKEGPGYPLYVNSLETALVKVEKFHEKETGVIVLSSNRQEVLDEEAKLFPKVEVIGTREGQVGKPANASSPVRGIGRGSKNSEMEERILAVLDVVRGKTPKQIKIDAGIDLTFGINSIMKRLGKENKVVVGYGDYKLHPSQVKQVPVPVTEEHKE